MEEQTFFYQSTIDVNKCSIGVTSADFEDHELLVSKTGNDGDVDISTLINTLIQRIKQEDLRNNTKVQLQLLQLINQIQVVLQGDR